MNRLLFTCSLLCLALGDLLRGRRVAFNAAPDDATVTVAPAADPAEAAPTYGLAKGVKAENVTRRKNSLILHGTEPLVAEKLAIEAEEAQLARDDQNARERAAAETKARDAVGEPTITDALDGLTVAALNDLAAAESITLGDATRKADLIAAIRAGRLAATAKK